MSEARRAFAEIQQSLTGLTPIQQAYLTTRWLDQVEWMEGAAKKAQRRYYRLRLVTVVGAVVVPVLVGLNLDGDAASAVSWLTVAISLVVAASAAVEEFFNFGERWRHYRRTVEALKAEGWLFIELVGEYAPPGSHGAAFPLFAERVEQILREDVNAYVTRVTQPKEKGEGGEG
jgi:hypothetical protein